MASRKKSKRASKREALKPHEIKDWKQLGLVRTPLTKRQGGAAVEAKHFVEGLKCFHELKKLMIAGRSSKDLRHFVKVENGEALDMMRGTMDKYFQLYKTF